MYVEKVEGVWFVLSRSSEDSQSLSEEQLRGIANLNPAQISGMIYRDPLFANERETLRVMIEAEKINA